MGPGPTGFSMGHGASRKLNPAVNILCIARKCIMQRGAECLNLRRGRSLGGTMRVHVNDEQRQVLWDMN